MQLVRGRAEILNLDHLALLFYNSMIFTHFNVPFRNLGVFLVFRKSTRWEVYDDSLTQYKCEQEYVGHHIPWGKSREDDYQNQNTGEGKGLGFIFVPRVFFSR